MKKRIILILILLIVIVPLVSCTQLSFSARAEATCEEFEQNSTVHKDVGMKVGEKLGVTLCSNQTTGYQWVRITNEDGILLDTACEYQEPKTDILGAGGSELWTFVAQKAGVTDVRMEYIRPWEGAQKGVRTFTMTVTVR